MVAIKDVAKLAGVSPSAVSKYYKSPDHMKESTKAQIAEAIRILNYHPNKLARSLRNGRSGVVAIVLPDIRNPFFSTFFHLMQIACYTNGLTPLLVQDMSPKEVSNVISLFKSGFLDGVICSDDGRFIKQAIQADVALPIILISPNPDVPVKSGVIMDLTSGMITLCQHLEDQKVRSVGYIGSLNDYSSTNKLSAIRSFCADHQMTIMEGAVYEDADHCDNSFDSGYHSCEQILSRISTLPDALICASDIIAMGAIKCLSHNDLRIPEDILLAGHDDTDIAVMNAPSITSVHIPLDQICELAVQKLLQLLNGEETQMQIVKTTLSVRTSTMAEKNRKLR